MHVVPVRLQRPELNSDELFPHWDAGLLSQWGVMNSEGKEEEVASQLSNQNMSCAQQHDSECQEVMSASGSTTGLALNLLDCDWQRHQKSNSNPLWSLTGSD